MGGSNQGELTSISKHEVFFGPTKTHNNVKPIGFKWVIVRKRNEKKRDVRYKAQLVSQGFCQRLGIDYDETYSSVICN